MTFDYNKSVWGKGTASLKWSDPANVRLRRCMSAFSVLPENAKILEVGCGAGTFIRALKSARPAWQCHGTDVSETALTGAKSADDGVEYSLCDVAGLPYIDNDFDGVALFDVLEHVEKPGVFLKEISRVLKSGGVLYAFVPCEGDITSLWHLLDKLGLKRDLTKKYAGHINFFSRATLKEILRANNFSVDKICYAEHFLGQILGVAVFKAMNKCAKISGNSQLNNEEFFKNSRKGYSTFIKNIVNYLVSLESTLFYFLPSPNVHLSARNKK